MKREELMARARRELWAVWAVSSEEIGAQAADTLYGLGMLVAPGEAAELVRLRREVAALRAERHVTNEALDDAVRELRARRDGAAERSADKLTQLLAPALPLPVEGEHYSAVHHAYRVPRDLPSVGGAL
jgi:hypothetical protein